MVKAGELTYEIRADTRKLKKDVDDAIGGAKRIAVNLVKGAESFTTGIRGGALTGEKSPGLAGTAGGLIGKFALITGVFQVIGSGIKKTVDLLGRMSPAMKGTFQILETTLGLFFKPFADFLGTLLRPLAAMLLKASLAWIKFTNTDFGKVISSALTIGLVGAGIGKLAGGIGLAGLGGGLLTVPHLAGIGLSVGAGIGVAGFVGEKTGNKVLGGIAGGALAGAGTGAIIGSVVPGIGTAIGAAGGAIIGAIVGGLSQVNWETVGEDFGKFLDDVGKGLQAATSATFDLLKGLGQWIWDGITTAIKVQINVLTAVGQWLWNVITNSIQTQISILAQVGSWLWNTITSALSGAANVISGFGQWLWSNITGALSNLGGAISGFGSWLWNSVISTVSNSLTFFKNLGQWIWDTVTSFISGLFQGVKNVGGGIVDFFKGMFGFKQLGGVVPETGPYVLHRGEIVQNRLESQNGIENRTVEFKPVINFYNARFGGETEARNALRDIDTQLRLTATKISFFGGG